MPRTKEFRIQYKNKAGTYVSAIRRGQRWTRWATWCTHKTVRDAHEHVYMLRKQDPNKRFRVVYGNKVVVDEKGTVTSEWRDA